MDVGRNFFLELDRCNVYEHADNEKIKSLAWFTSQNFWVQFTSVFVWSIILAPISRGILYIILFIILFEIIVSIIYKMRVCIFTRLGLACAAIAGFIIGRAIYAPSGDPFDQLKDFSPKEEVADWLNYFK